MHVPVRLSTSPSFAVSNKSMQDIVTGRGSKADGAPRL